MISLAPPFSAVQKKKPCFPTLGFEQLHVSGWDGCGCRYHVLADPARWGLISHLRPSRVG